MSRPRVEPRDRISTALRLPRELHEALSVEAEARDVSFNWFVCRLLDDAIGRLIPVDDLVLTRDRGDR